MNSSKNQLQGPRPFGEKKLKLKLPPIRSPTAEKVFVNCLNHIEVKTGESKWDEYERTGDYRLKEKGKFGMNSRSHWLAVETKEDFDRLNRGWLTSFFGHTGEPKRKGGLSSLFGKRSSFFGAGEAAVVRWDASDDLGEESSESSVHLLKSKWNPQGRHTQHSWRLNLEE